MIDFCDICGSIALHDQCSNERCGTGNIPRGWKPRKTNGGGKKLEVKMCSLKEVSDKDETGFSEWFCDACQGVWEWADASQVKFCPECGAKVVSCWAKEGE